MFVEFFIRRPIFATVCAILIVLVGAVSIPTLPIAQFPNLAPPQVSVGSFYTGANAEVVESAVTRPLEQQINGVEGMKYMTSTSSNDGSSSINVTFDIDRNIDVAAVDIQNRVSQAQGRLPGEVNQTGIGIQKSGNSFVFAAGFYAENNRYDSLFISNYLDIYVRDALKRVKGVGDVFIFGERKYSMRIWLDPVRMAARKLTAADVTNALREQNVQVAAGQIGQQPAPSGQNYQMSVRAVGRLVEPKEFGEIVLKSDENGAIVKLKDVGRVELGAENYSSELEFNGQSAIGIGITQLSGANALEVNRDALAELERLAKTFPPGLKYDIAFNTTSVVRESIVDVLMTLVEAIILVIIVMFIFLQDWRSTLIPAVTIPVSLIGAFIFVKAFGFSINTLTLFGITLATGLVVDDAIVVIENVQRHINEGMHDAHEAATVAMKEVAGAVIATSLVLIAVFVPVAFFPGTTGILFKQFALTIAFSVAISAFNALTLTPALSALWLGKTHHGEGRFWTRVNHAIEATTHKYKDSLHWALRHKVVVAIAFVILSALTYLAYQRVPRGFVPNEDQGWFMTIVQAPEGASLEYTTKIAQQAEKEIMKQPEVASAFAVAGFSFGGNAPNRAMLFASMKDLKERKGDDHSVEAVINRLQPALGSIPGAMIFPFAPPSVQGLGSFGGFEFILQDRAGRPIQEFAQIAQGFAMSGFSRPEIAFMRTDFTANDPQLLVTIDREKAKALQVQLRQITDALAIYMGSQYVNDFDFNNRSYRVIVQADQNFRANPRVLKEFYVRSDNGSMVPLDSLVSVSQSVAPQVISHHNLFRSASISGSPKPGYSSGQAIAAIEELAKTLPQGVVVEWTGISLEEIQSGGQALLLFGLGGLVVYLTLAAQYESFVLPFIVMLAVPMALLGAIVAIASRGLQNDIYAQIGLVMLIGLATKNAILIVEFAEQLRERGMSLVEAAVEAARIRLRPILMTSLAFILGVVPLVIASGAGQESRHAVGTTVFGGMIAATTLNLVFIPVLYVMVRSLQGKK